MQKVYSKINNISLVILAATAITVGLIYTRTILVPFVIALFIYFVTAPGVKWFHTRLKMHRLLTFLIIIIFAILCLIILAFFISTSLEGFFKSGDIYKNQIIQFVRWTGERATKFGIRIDENSIQNQLKNLPFFTMAKDLTGEIFTFLGNTTLVTIFVLFLIAGEIRKKKPHPLISEIYNKVSRYLTIKCITSLTTGCLFGLVLGLFGVKLAFMFAVMTVLLNFIPNIGSIIATLIPLPVVLLQFGLGWKFIIILTITASIQFLIGNIIEPKIMGKNMGIHPVAILLFLMFWGLVWGIPGMFLAVPITGVLKIILSRIETTKPISEILSGNIPS
ncbi:MAG: AI-2E family transporter [Spirochaetes bacterium]|nr:AI-2E family transporter [Spirochaetota bacterium]